MYKSYLKHDPEFCLYKIRMDTVVFFKTLHDLTVSISLTLTALLFLIHCAPATGLLDVL